MEALKDWDGRDWIEELLNPSNMFLVSFMETNGDVKLWSHLYRKGLDDKELRHGGNKEEWVDISKFLMPLLNST